MLLRLDELNRSLHMTHFSLVMAKSDEVSRQAVDLFGLFLATSYSSHNCNIMFLCGHEEG